MQLNKGVDLDTTLLVKLGKIYPAILKRAPQSTMKSAIIGSIEDCIEENEKQGRLKHISGFTLQWRESIIIYGSFETALSLLIIFRTDGKCSYSITAGTF